MTATAPTTEVLLALVDELRTQNRLLVQQVGELQTTRTELQTTCAELQTTCAELRARNELLEEENHALRQQVRVLTERVDLLERDNADLMRRVTGRTTERTGRRGTTSPRPKNDEEAQRKRRERRDQRRSQLDTYRRGAAPRRSADQGVLPLVWRWSDGVVVAGVLGGVRVGTGQADP